MAYELRMARMKPHELEGAPPGFLGEPPDLDETESMTLAFFWRVRHATPPDQPLDLEAALRLHDRLLGPPRDDLALVEDLESLDTRYAEIRAEQRNQEIGKGKQGGRRASRTPARSLRR